MDDTPPISSPDPVPSVTLTTLSAEGDAAASGPRIRSRPTPSKAPRLPGTYAANYGGDDMNWRRGVGVLWTLFALAATGEILRAAFYLLAGHAGWPLAYDVARVSIGAAVFVALWLGWGWTRWVLAVTDFLFGAWLTIMVVAGHMAQNAPDAVARGQLPPGDPIVETLPKLALGVVYLFTAGYLAFSADVVDFVRHRREEGRGWVVVPVALLAAAYVALVVTAQVPYWFYVGAEVVGAKQFGDETLRAMCDHWNPDALGARGDEAFLTMWPDATRKSALASLSPLGGLKDFSKSHVKVDSTVIDASGNRFSMRHHYGQEGVDSAQGHDRSNLVLIKIEGTTTDASGNGFVMQYHYDRERVNFTHGHAHFNLVLIRHPFGGWKLDNFVVYDIVMDPVPGMGAAVTPNAAPGGTPPPSG